MSSPERFSSSHRDFGYLCRPIPYHNRMATDVRLPPECELLSRIARDSVRDIPPEDMNAYCQRVIKQLEEDDRLGIKRELVY